MASSRDHAMPALERAAWTSDAGDGVRSQGTPVPAVTVDVVVRSTAPATAPATAPTPATGVRRTPGRRSPQAARAARASSARS